MVEHQVAFDAADVMHALDVLALAPQVFYLAPAETSSDDARWPPDDDVLSGRDVCRLHSLMLC